jgi:hypothetical protein
MSIHINKLLPEGVSIEKFKTGSELLLTCELGKYTKLLLREDLSATDINVDDELKKTSHFSFVVQSKFVNDLPYGDVQLAKFNHGDFLLKTQSVAKADLKFEDRHVYFNYNSDVKANRDFRGKSRSAAYVSLMAFVLVKNFIDDEPNRKLIIDHSRRLRAERWRVYRPYRFTGKRYPAQKPTRDQISNSGCSSTALGNLCERQSEKRINERGILLEREV